MDPLGLIRFVFNAGAHVWFPVSIPNITGATGGNLSGEWWGLSYYKNEFKATWEHSINSLGDIGVSVGITGLSGCKDGEERTIGIGLGKYKGVQFTFKGGKLEGISLGYGYGWNLISSIPVTYTYPRNSFLGFD